MVRQTSLAKTSTSVCSVLLLAAGLAIALGAPGCGSSSSKASPDGGSGSDSGAGNAPAILGVAYNLVSDSSGTTPAAGSTITLFFEPNGKSTITAVNATLMLSHHGTWSYSGGQLTIDFTASDFHPNATFALDLASTKVTMPFQVFSTSAGSSTWTQTLPDVVGGAFLAAYGLASDSIVPCVSVQEVVAEAARYVSARTGVTPKSDGNVPWPPVPQTMPGGGVCAGESSADPDAGMTGKRHMRAFIDPKARRAGSEDVPVGGASGPTSSPPTLHTLGMGSGSAAPPLSGIIVTPAGLFLDFGADPPYNETQILLFSFLNSNLTGTFSLAPLASDPRTDLIPMAPGDGADDPTNKKALLINPIQDAQWFSWNTSGWQPTPNGAWLATTGYGGQVEATEAGLRLATSWQLSRIKVSPLNN
jgi:hypothetical protein